MSRRKGEVGRLACVVHIECPAGHRVGMCVLHRHGLRDGESPFRIGLPLERIDGPNGETKVLVVCPTCVNAGSKATPQIRWDRIEAVLREMDAEGNAPARSMRAG